MSHRRFWLLAAIAVFAALAIFSAPRCEAVKRPAPPPDGALKPSEVVWSQAKDGLTVAITAANDLNFAYGSPLGITVCLYQLSDMAKFSELASSFGGVAKLLGGGLDLLGGAALMSRVVYVQPGEKISLTLDRMEGAKYFAAAAGYAHGDAARCSAYVPFPVRTTVIKLKRRRTTYYTAGTLAAGVSLSAEAVTVTGGEGIDER